MKGARPEEAERVRYIDGLLRLHADETRKLARERAKITGRALKRALYVPVAERRKAAE